MQASEHPLIRLHAAPGQALRITLHAAAGAGLVWQAQQVPAGCRLSSVAGGPPSSNDVGGMVTQAFELICDGPGQPMLRFELRRPWEPRVWALQTVRVVVS